MKINFDKLTREELVEARQELLNTVELKSQELMQEDDKLTQAYQEDKATQAIKNRKRKLKKEASDAVWNLNQFDKEFNKRFRHDNAMKEI